MLFFSMVGLFGGWVYPGVTSKGWYEELGVGLGVVVERRGSCCMKEMEGW